MMKQIAYVLLLSLMFGGFSGLSQPKDKQQGYEEEIIRYLGYEEIPVRYISLPYDATMSHNVEGNFMDIGFILLMFIPLIFLWRTKSNKLKILLFSLLGIMGILAIGSSHVLSKSGLKLAADSEQLREYIGSDVDGPLRSFVSQVYQFFGSVYRPIGDFVGNLTGEGDQITYIVLLAILYVLYFVYSRFTRQKEISFLLGALLLFYSFFMLILSAGIIWYGFLMFPLLYLEVSKYVDESKTYRLTFIVAGSLFIILSYFLKVSNTNRRSDIALGPIQPPVLAYNFSNAEGNDVYEGYFRNIGPALDQINAEDESLIYMAGTFLTYLIRNNNQRVFKDGILNIHSQMVDKYKRKSIVNRALKASGFKYIVVSPNLHIMDQTPEKSLTAKFQKMVSYLHENPGLKLLATDRLVRTIDENGVPANAYKFLFGNDVEVLQNGQYAIFEIL